MALQELYPPPQITGPAQLGAVIANAGDRYATNARQDQVMNKVRAQQLSDISSAHDYSDARFNTDRMARLTDAQKLNMQQVRDAMVAEAEKEGILSIADAEDPAKVGPAIQEMNRRGLLTKYAPLLQAGALKVDQVQDPNAVNAAIQAEATKTAAENDAKKKAALNSLNFGQVAADRALKRQNGIQDSIDQLNQQLQQPPRQPTPSEILSRARELWLIDHPKEKVAPTDVGALAGQVTAATKELRDQTYMARQDEIKTVQQQIAMLRYQLTETAKSDAVLGQQGFFADPKSTVQVPTSHSPVNPLIGGSPMQSFQQMLNQAAPPPAPVSTSAAGPTDMAPALSIKGAVQRLPSAAQIVSAPANLVDTVGRYGGALVNGLYDGNYAVPQTGIIDAARRAMGTSADGTQLALPTPAELNAATGRPITSAPSIFSTPTNWWNAGR